MVRSTESFIFYKKKKEAVQFTKDWNKFTDQQADFCSKVITQETLKQRSDQNSFYEKQVILLRKKLTNGVWKIDELFQKSCVL